MSPRRNTAGGERADRPVTDADVQRVAIEFNVHPRTLVRALAGLAVRGQAGVRAQRAVDELRRRQAA